MSVIINKTTPLFPASIFIQWTIDPFNETGDVLVDVERSGGPEGPWERIATDLVNTYHYLDDKFNEPAPDEDEIREGVNLFSLSRQIYYRIIATPPSGELNSVASSPTPIEPGLPTKLRLLKRKLLRDLTVGLNKLNGIPLAVLKRKHWGTRCQDCWDPVTSEGLLEHCSNCYGTTFEGGYWNPVIIRGRIDESPIQTQTTGHGKSDVRVANFTMPEYPLVEESDILVDLRNNNRWLVKMTGKTSLQTVVVHQRITLSLLARDTVQYEFKVDPNTTPPLY